MSSIKIVCRKDIWKEEKDNKNKSEKGNELIIKANQIFMNTEQFFNSVKESVEKYFTSIEKK